MKKKIVVGIDPSSYKIAVVVTNDTDVDYELRTAHLSKTKKPLACKQAFGFINGLIDSYEDGQMLVYLEAPVLGRGGARATIPQSIIDGAIITAFALRDVPVVMVNNSKWKKIVCLNGHADKPKIAATVLQIWPQLYKEADGDQDLLDAACINRYGVKLAKAAERVKRSTAKPRIVRVRSVASPPRPPRRPVRPLIPS